MKKIILFYLSFCTSVVFAQSFYQQFPTALNLDYDVAAVEISNGYILGDNEANSANNFHGVIRLSRTDFSGNILWSKQYDAGSGTTVHLLNLLKTFDGNVLAIGYTGPDNNSVASQKFIFKMDNNGTILWSKQYSSALGYQENAIAQLSDSSVVFAVSVFSGGNFPALFRIDTAGNFISAIKYNVINSAINNIVPHNNSLDIILGSSYVLNTNLFGAVINWQRQYNNTLQFNSLLSNRCSNGDLIYIAGQIAGGFGDGTSRIFRTDSAGNLKWSKNILAWSGPTSSSGTNFDVVSQVAVKESANGNIVGVLLDEGGTLLFSVFDSTGSYLYNRNHVAIGQQHHVTETSSGNFLIGSIFGFQTFSTFSSYPLFPANACDSILSVSITTGVDSATTTAPVTVNAETVSFNNLTITVTPITISPVLFCNPVGIAETENTPDNNISIYPNPSANILHVQFNNLQIAQIKIIDVLGKEELRKTIYNGDNVIDISEIKDGIYFVFTSDKQNNILKLVVQKK